MSPSRKLTAGDIADLRAYEREREAFRQRIIELKQLRRIAVGPLVTFVFENRDTMRFQIQEMVRAERMLTDAAVQAELDAYNPLIPEAGELSVTMFIELTSAEQVREWLPKLVGIERCVEMRISEEPIPGLLDPGHAEQLTREDTTASVHYLKFTLTPRQVEQFPRHPVSLVIHHPAYDAATLLSQETKAELLRDLREDGS